MPRAHLRQHSERRIEHTPEHHVQGCREIFRSCLHGPNLDYSRIIHQDIDLTKAFRGLSHEVTHLFPVGNITWHAQYLCTALYQVVARPLEFFGVTGTEDQATAGTRELSGQRQA